MAALTRVTSEAYIDLGYIHTAPFFSLSSTLSHAFDDPVTKDPSIIHADYEGLYILAVHPGIVFKFAPSYTVLDARELAALPNPHGQQQPATFTWNFGPVPSSTSMLTSLKRSEGARYHSIEVNRKLAVQHEGKMLDALAQALEKEGCLNVIQPHLAVSEGVFLPRLEGSIQSRLEAASRCRSAPASKALQLRWAKQIAHSLAWLEREGYFHGDLKPANVLLDVHDNAILSDFGSCDKVGAYLRTGCGVYTVGWGKGGPQSEAYAYGWTLYDIFNGGHAEELDEVENASNVVFPSTAGLVFEEVIQRCWRKEFGSMKELEEAVVEVYLAQQEEEQQKVDTLAEDVAARNMKERREGFVQRMEEVYVSLKGGSSMTGTPRLEKIRPRATST